MSGIGMYKNGTRNKLESIHVYVEHLKKIELSVSRHVLFVSFQCSLVKPGIIKKTVIRR